MIAPHPKTVHCPLHGRQTTTSCVIECPACKREEWESDPTYLEFVEMLKNLPEDGEG